MSRIPALDPASAAPEAKRVLDAVGAQLGVVPNLFKVAANSPAALGGMVQLRAALGRGRFDAATAESIALTVAEIDRCDYCLSAHSVLGEGAGLDLVARTAARDARAADPKPGPS